MQAYPPFVLRAAGDSGDDGDGGQGHYYDGQLLAMYMVSRGVFQCPITRRKLTVQVGVAGLAESCRVSSDHRVYVSGRRFWPDPASVAPPPPATSHPPPATSHPPPTA